jgi:hypothetical protein
VAIEEALTFDKFIVVVADSAGRIWNCKASNVARKIFDEIVTL